MPPAGGMLVLGTPLTPAQAAAAAAFLSNAQRQQPAVEVLPESSHSGKRDSAVTAAKYNKWVVGELNRAIVTVSYTHLTLPTT